MMSESSNYDPFNDIEEQPRARKCDGLEKGVKYVVTKLYPKISTFADDRTKVKPMNTHCVFLDGDLLCTTILPRKFNDKPDLYYKTMNALIEKKMGPSLVYYGKVGLGNEVDLLRHTQEIDQGKLQRITNIESRELAAKEAAKRKLDDSFGQSPMKRTNSDASTSSN